MDVVAKLPDPPVGRIMSDISNSLPSEVERAASPDNSITLESGIWVATLRCFCNLRNHALSEAEKVNIVAHDFAPELGIIRQVLRRSLLLSLNAPSERLPFFLESHEELVLADESFNLARGNAAGKLSMASGTTLAHTFSHLWRTSEALLSSKADLQAWTSFARIMRQELSQSPVIIDLERRTHESILRQHQTEIQKLTERITHAPLAADMFSIFLQLAYILEQLKLIEVLLKQDHPLKQALAIFTLVHEKARSLIEFIEKRVLAAVEIEEPVFEALDSTVYAVGMELLKVYSQELVGLASLRHAPAIYTKVENAHGLLRDSFQQTTVALAQLFDPNLDGARLFRSFHTKLEQYLTCFRSNSCGRLRRNVIADLWLRCSHNSMTFAIRVSDS